MKVEQIFDCHQVDYERRISLAPCSFKGLTMKWWTTLENQQCVRIEQQITRRTTSMEDYLNTSYSRESLRGRVTPPNPGMKGQERMKGKEK